jgi:hypothetical protein
MRDCDRLRAAVDAELGEDALNVRRHGLGTDDELGSDRFLAHTVREPGNDVPLPVRQSHAITPKVRSI